VIAETAIEPGQVGSSMPTQSEPCSLETQSLKLPHASLQELFVSYGYHSSSESYEDFIKNIDDFSPW
jgi:hypothetical protein